MGVRLDWEIEHEGATTAQEHPLDVRARRATQRSALLAFGLVVLLVLGVVGLVAARLWYVDTTIEQQLRDTVAAETAALRIGDVAGFLYVQRSASEAWIHGQSDRFWEYQQLKLEQDVDLSGHILGLTIDENRARVMVEEIIDGVPYRVVWFYWRYEEGWRHVPMDVAFWGEPGQLAGQNFTIDYYELDEAAALALEPGVQILWTQGCAWLACATPLPALTVRILPDPAVGVSWSPDEADTLLISSPLTGRARADVPLEPQIMRQVGGLLADRLLDQALGGLRPVPFADAAFLHTTLRAWLAGHMLGDGALGSRFVQSLVEAYGEAAPDQLASLLQPDSTIGILWSAFVTPLDLIPVVWDEYFQWRLNLEPQVIAAGDRDRLLALYDASAQNEALARLADPQAAANAPIPQVSGVSVGPGADGIGVARVSVVYADGSAGVIPFRLVDGVWRRGVAEAAPGAPGG